MAYNPVLPLLALGGLGGVAVSGAVSLWAKNPFAKALFPDIPRGAKPYPNYIQRIATNDQYTNNTWRGWFGFCGVAGAIYIGTAALTFRPVRELLRKQFIYIPGTTTPRRIKHFGDLLYDICPDIFVLTAPLIAAIPIGMAVKVALDGPGRFNNFSKQWNPYDSIVARAATLHERPQLPQAPLRQVTDQHFHFAQPLLSNKSADQLYKDHAMLNNNTY